MRCGAPTRRPPLNRMARQAPLPTADTDVFRLLVQSVSEYAIFLFDAEGRTGYAADDVLGNPCAGQELLRLAADQGCVEEHAWWTRKDGSRQIVEQHEGRIEAEFPRDGGTRLVVVLPVD